MHAYVEGQIDWPTYRACRIPEYAQRDEDAKPTGDPTIEHLQPWKIAVSVRASRSSSRAVR